MNPTIRAIALLVFANGLTATVDSIAKHLSPGLHPVQIVWGYYTMIAVTLLVIVAARSISIRELACTTQLPLQLARSLMLALTLATLFAGIAKLPLADVIALTFMAPLFITLVAVPVLGERFALYRVIAVLVGFVGVVVILKPGFNTMTWVLAMPLLSAFGWCWFQILTRKLAATEQTGTTLLYTTAGGVLWSSLAVMFVWRLPTLDEFIWLGAAGLLGAAAHFCLIRAFEAAEASLLAPFNYVKLVWIAIFGYMVFNEVPSWHTLLGSSIIIVSGIYVLLRARLA